MAFCRSCGTQVSGGAFCISCGSSVVESYQTNVATPINTPQQFLNTTQQYQSAPAATGNTLSTLGMTFGAIGLLYLPVLIGVTGIVLSAVAKSKGEKNANLALGISIAGTVLGMLLGAAVGASSF